ncbi:MAG: hypothetical protein WA776_10375 [Xanthobacteraceae bacterium]
MENLPYDFDAAFQSLVEGSPQMLLVLSSQFFSLQREHIAKLAIQQRLPSMFIFKGYVQAGGLISYGVDPKKPCFVSWDFMWPKYSMERNLPNSRSNRLQNLNWSLI